MTIQLLVKDVETKEELDISDLVQEVVWSTSIQGRAGQLNFTLIPTEYNFSCGSKVWFSVTSNFTKVNVFMGYVFNTQFNKNHELNVLCYDQTRYLNNRDVYVFKQMTAAQIFEKICKDYQLNYKVAASSKYVCDPATRDNVSLMDMIQRALDETFVKTAESNENKIGTYLFVRDNYGVLTLDNIENYRRNYIVDKDMLELDFSYSRSIDKDTATRVKLVRKDSSGNVHQIEVLENSNLTKKWGILHHYEVIDTPGSQAELHSRAENLLKLKGRPTEKITFTTEGLLDVFAGCGLFVNLEDISYNRMNKFCIVTSARHTFKNNEHLMDLEVNL